MKGLIYYLITILIWGSTWIAITFQINVVDPVVSLFYRFLLASLILFAWCFVMKLKMRFKKEEYFFMALQGVFLFGVNYLLLYFAQLHLTSGLCAVIFSIILVLNVINSNIFLGTPVNLKVVLGGITGLFGICLVFLPEITNISANKSEIFSLLLAFTGTLFASFGNIISARNQKNGLPIVQTNAFGMLFGTILMFGLSMVLGKTFNFPMSFSFISSLGYLSLFGSVIAFWLYLSLVGKIGPEKAAYATLVFPVVALIISTFAEGYTWTFSSMAGVLLVLFGNFIAMGKKRTNRYDKAENELKNAFEQ